MSTTNIIALTKLINNIQDALGTEETGNALIEIARNAHKAEQELAALKSGDISNLGNDNWDNKK